MAKPTAGCLLPAGLLRRDTGQNPRRRLWQTEGAKFWLRIVNEREATPRSAGRKRTDRAPDITPKYR